MVCVRLPTCLKARIECSLRRRRRPRRCHLRLRLRLRRVRPARSRAAPRFLDMAPTRLAECASGATSTSVATRGTSAPPAAAERGSAPRMTATTAPGAKRIRGRRLGAVEAALARADARRIARPRLTR